MRCSVLSTLLGLAAALPGQILERQQEASTVTVTEAAHPLTFWPLAHLASTATPLSYDEPPTASRVPANQHNNANAAADCTSVLQSPAARINQTSSTTTTAPTPSASTTICTVIEGQYPISTLPAFCRPTLFANAPALASPADPQVAQSTAVVTMSANSVPDKVSCCGECATYYNCFAWRFVPSYIGTPSERLPGGFDPWRHGDCEIAYYTGQDDADGGSGVTRKGAARVCPNGRLHHVLNGTGNPGSGGWIEGLYFNGWNQGACADLGAVVYLPGRDPGVGDESGLCPV
ncbi:hypothetical protein F4678DRAFT_419337 [Xylaria arbuscula]|nr:hypothetical protein F4678DRAFT_419337 [Xylaria arbuscula]